MLSFNWPTEWNRPFVESLEKGIEEAIAGQMSKKSLNFIHGKPAVSELNLGTTPPRLSLKHIHCLSPSRISLSLAFEYSGEASISFSGVSFNLDTTIISPAGAGVGVGGSAVSTGGGKAGGGAAGSAPPLSGAGGAAGAGAVGAAGAAAVGDTKTSTTDANGGTGVGAGGASASPPTSGIAEDGSAHMPFLLPFEISLSKVRLQGSVDIEITQAFAEGANYFSYVSTTTSSSPSPAPSSGGLRRAADEVDDRPLSSFGSGGGEAPPVGAASAAPAPAAEKKEGADKKEKKKAKVSCGTMPLSVMVQSLAFTAPAVGGIVGGDDVRRRAVVREAEAIAALHNNTASSQQPHSSSNAPLPVAAAAHNSGGVRASPVAKAPWPRAGADGGPLSASASASASHPLGHRQHSASASSLGLLRPSTSDVGLAPSDSGESEPPRHATVSASAVGGGAASPVSLLGAGGGGPSHFATVYGPSGGAPLGRRPPLGGLGISGVGTLGIGRGMGGVAMLRGRGGFGAAAVRRPLAEEARAGVALRGHPSANYYGGGGGATPSLAPPPFPAGAVLGGRGLLHAVGGNGSGAVVRSMSTDSPSAYGLSHSHAGGGALSSPEGAASAAAASARVLLHALWRRYEHFWAVAPSSGGPPLSSSGGARRSGGGGGDGLGDTRGEEEEEGTQGLRVRSFLDAYLFKRYARIPKTVVPIDPSSAAAALIGADGNSGSPTDAASKEKDKDKKAAAALTTRTVGGTRVRILFFTDPIKSFSLQTNFTAIGVDRTLEGLVRTKALRPAIDSLLAKGVSFVV